MYCPINTFFPAVTGTETSLTYDLYIKQVLKTKTPVYHEHFYQSTRSTLVTNLITFWFHISIILEIESIVLILSNKSNEKTG